LYTLHYVHKILGWPLIYFKHTITPLPFEQTINREDGKVLEYIRASLSNLEINGPNTVIGVLPDGTLFTCCDSKKLRPVVVGRDEDTVIICSEVVGINDLLPDRNWAEDIYPGENEMIVINNNLEVERCLQ